METVILRWCRLWQQRIAWTAADQYHVSRCRYHLLLSESPFRMLAAANQLTSPDYVVIAVYLVGTIGLGLWIGRRTKTGDDFFLAGRRLPWWAIGMSLVATDIGGTDIIGVGGAAYAHGMAVANFEWIGCVPAMVVAAFVFIPLCSPRAGSSSWPATWESCSSPRAR
jgi:hypothetical protein